MRRVIPLLLALLLLCSCTVPHSDNSSKQPQITELGEAEKARLCEEASALIKLDAEVYAIFALQSLAEYAESDVSIGEYTTLSEDCPYKSFSAVESLLDSVYSKSSELAKRYLAYPPHGVSALRKNALGETEISTVYKSDFYTDVGNASVSFLGLADGIYSFQYNSPKLCCTFRADYGENGMRLLDSLLFIYEDSTSAVKEYSSLENSGSAKRLRGACTVLNIYVTAPNSVWTPGEKSIVAERVNAACDYLKAQGTLWGVTDLSFTLLDSELSFGKDVPASDYGEAWVTELAAEHGSLEEITKSLYSGDNSVILLHVNASGRSFSAPYKKNRGEYYEYSLMYHSDFGTYRACAATYAHELLHAFGAVDLYSETLTEYGEALAGLYFENDIMRSVPDNLAYAKVGALTAKLVGWTDILHGQLKELLNECKIY